jgi:hypothetical protein
VNSVAITLCVASQRVFVVVVSLSTQSGNFWIRPSILHVQHFHTFILQNNHAVDRTAETRKSGRRTVDGESSFREVSS